MTDERKPGAASDHAGEPGSDGEPVRLRDAGGEHAPSGLADALAGAALGRRPTGAQLDDLRRALAAALPGSADGAPPPAATPRLAGAWRAALVGALLVVGAGALWYGLADRTTAPPAVPAASPPAAPVSVVAAPAVPVVPAVPAPDPAPAAVDSPPAEKKDQTPGRAGRGGGELRLLSRAQQALIERPSLALALAARHERLFPDGALAQEREVIAIEALRRLHRTAEADARARRFRARYPHSAHLPRVEGQRL